MDLQKIITDLLAQFNVDKKLVTKFQQDPIGTVKSLLGAIQLDPTQLKTIVDGITAKIKLDDAAGLLGSLFGKK